MVTRILIYDKELWAGYFDILSEGNTGQYIRIPEFYSIVTTPYFQARLCHQFSIWPALLILAACSFTSYMKYRNKPHNAVRPSAQDFRSIILYFVIGNGHMQTKSHSLQTKLTHNICQTNWTETLYQTNRTCAIRSIRNTRVYK